MEFRSSSLLLLVCVSLILLTSTEGWIQPCCLKVSKRIPHEIRAEVIGHAIQKKSGRCEIDALILYTKKKKICAPLRLLKEMKLLKHLRKTS